MKANHSTTVTSVTETIPSFKRNFSDWPHLSTQQTTEDWIGNDVSSAFIANNTLTTNHSWITKQTPDGIGFSKNFTTLIDDVTTFNFTTSSSMAPDGILAYIIVYGCIVIVGLCLNILAILAILLITKLRTAQNMFVLNLCFADILLGVNALFAFVDEIGNGMDFEDSHERECQILGFMTFIPPIAVVLSMTVIARNRYKTIAGMYHNAAMFNKRKVILYSCIVWAIAILVALPILIAEMEIITGLFCTCCFSFSANKIYGFTMTIFLYLFPNYIILYSYICIFVIVRRSRQKVRVMGFVSSGNLKKHDLQLAVQFILLFALFNICYLPTMIIFWLEEDSSISGECRAFVMLLFACNILANPLAYIAMNKGARNELRKLCCKRKVSPESHVRTHHSEVPEEPTPVTRRKKSCRKVTQKAVENNDDAKLEHPENEKDNYKVGVAKNLTDSVNKVPETASTSLEGNDISREKSLQQGNKVHVEIVKDDSDDYDASDQNKIKDQTDHKNIEDEHDYLSLPNVVIQKDDSFEICW